MAKKYIYKSGFSLVEVLISILFLSVILLLALPAVTKKAANIPFRGGHIGFYFNEASAKNSDFPCYTTTLDNAGETTVVKDETGTCQIHEFVVPKNIHKIDFTLVAGGGGGGGAAGETVYKKEFSYAGGTADTPVAGLAQERIKSIVINYLTGSGAAGQDADTTANSTIYAGQGGASGAGILNFKLPETFTKAYYEPSFEDEAGTVTLSWGTKTDLSSLASTFTGIRAFDSLGLLLDVADVDDAIGVFAADGSNDNLETTFECFLGKNDSDGISGNVGYYGMPADSSGATAGDYGVLIDGTSTTSYSNGLINNCGLTPLAYKLPVAGSTSYYTGASVGSGYLVPGGKGGQIAGMPESYGKGGKGQGAMIVCGGTSTTCTTPNNYAGRNTTTYSDNRIKSAPNAETTVANAGAKATISIENPGGVGGGGAGGSAVKIKGFPVVPGDKYTIVVGAGGGGGIAGKSGVIAGNGSYETAPSAGTNGLGGSSTAIYDSEGALVMMVIGGAGGYGGKVNNDAYTIPSSNSEFGTYLPLPDLPDEARNVPIVFIGNSYVTNTTFSYDENIVTEVTKLTANDDTDLGVDDAAGYRIVYSYVTNTNIPIFELNSNSTDVAKGTAIDRDEEDYYDKTGGFSAFGEPYNVDVEVENGDGTTSTVTTTVNAVYLKPDMEYGGVETPLSTYNGLFKRYLTGNLLSYSGGLGGFSGLGNKAGCGGLFVGNKDSLMETGESTYAKNTFIVNVAPTESENAENKIFAVSDYYDGCTLKNSDGATAEFKAPFVSAFSGEKYGQAGAGGGGGGWNSKFGAGKGGAGQNGYVFITWH